MSGDVQPRKRKDKKKKKDDLGVEEPRGTAAALGEGDVFMHSYSDHGTGGHWCAKIIFFSLLAVLITLIGLIILENRGITELEANSVESRYSGVLEGWIEDAPDDDHHDEHTLELNHHDEDDEEHGSQLEHDEDENHDDENEEHEDVDDDEHELGDSDEDHENDEDDNEDNENNEEREQEENDEDDDDDNENDEEREQEADNSEEADADDTVDENDDDDANEESAEQNVDTAEEDEKEDDVDDSIENQQDDDEENEDDLKENNSIENDNEEDNAQENDDDDSEENDDFLQNDATQEDDDDHEEAEEVTNNIEIETIEKEVSDEDVASTEEPAQEDDDDNQEDVSEELPPEEDTSVEDDDVEFLEPDELDELPIVEPITAPKGKPLPEVGDSPSTEKPQDTLADEEEYERQQDELRREKEQASQGMWLKLTVGGALLVATHAVLRRATASRETEEEPDSREETPISDRRMTLISEPVSPPTVTPKAPEVRPKEVEVEIKAVDKSSVKEDSEEEEEEIFVSKPIQSIQTAPTPKDTIDKELYSDEEIEEEIEDEEEEEEIIPTKSEPQQAVPQAPIPDVTKEVTPEPDEDDDVEIIDEEQLEEEIEEEEISDVDDAELLTRLEEKYGRLPDPEPARPPRHKDGGNSIEDEWPGEPADAFWSQRLEQAQREMREGDWAAALGTASSPALANSGRARYIVARALDAAAEAKKDNKLLSKAIAAYLEVLKMNERLSDAKLLEVASRALDRIRFRGTYLSAEPVYKLLIRRFPNDPAYRNNLTISLLMANRADLAENVLKETLKLWPNDRVALAHYGFILKTLHNRLEDAVEAFSKALEGDAGAANEPRFYYHLGDALLLLGRFDDAHKVHKRGAELGHFLSPAQRSLYNVNRLKSKPWWNVHQTPYSRLALALEKSWKEILKEGEAARALYEKEKEGLRERGEWSQLDLFVQGREVPDRCSRAAVTCGIVKSEIGASGCRRGQIKFSMMEAGTHVRPHVGPTNCRLRMHLGLSNTKDTFLRVDQETRQWQTGKVLMFDDSFEHEVWHNGTGTRLVLIVDVWHPDLTPKERRQLPAI